MRNCCLMWQVVVGVIFLGQGITWAADFDAESPFVPFDGSKGRYVAQNGAVFALPAHTLVAENIVQAAGDFLLNGEGQLFRFTDLTRLQELAADVREVSEAGLVILGRERRLGFVDSGSEVKLSNRRDIRRVVGRFFVNNADKVAGVFWRGSFHSFAEPGLVDITPAGLALTRNGGLVSVKDNGEWRLTGLTQIAAVSGNLVLKKGGKLFAFQDGGTLPRAVKVEGLVTEIYGNYFRTADGTVRKINVESIEPFKDPDFHEVASGVRDLRQWISAGFPGCAALLRTVR
jgi:hypothetical protein